jgi:LysM repeat protein
MTTTRYIIFIVLVTSAIVLAGCKLSASTPPPAVTETPDSAMSTLEAELGDIATQTSVAGGGAETAPTQPPSGEVTDTSPTETAPGTAPETSPETSPETGPEATEPPPQPSSTPAPVSTATPGKPQNYQLQKGEFPFCLARRFNVDQTELLNLNGLGSASVLPIGYTLKIPQTGNRFVGQRALISHPDNYTVVAGDSIYSIACKYGDVDPLAIAQANSLSSPYNLSAGQNLHIP